MKSFNLEAAKRGDPLITREGESVKFVAYVPEAHQGKQVIILTESKDIRLYFVGGNYYDSCLDEFDLFMAPKKRTVWVNFQPSVAGIAYFYNKQEDADKVAHEDRLGGKAYPVEIDD